MKVTRRKYDPKSSTAKAIKKFNAETRANNKEELSTTTCEIITQIELTAQELKELAINVLNDLNPNTFELKIALSAGLVKLNGKEVVPTSKLNVTRNLSDTYNVLGINL